MDFQKNADLDVNELLSEPFEPHLLSISSISTSSFHPTILQGRAATTVSATDVSETWGSSATCTPTHVSTRSASISSPSTATYFTTFPNMWLLSSEIGELKSDSGLYVRPLRFVRRTYTNMSLEANEISESDSDLEFVELSELSGVFSHIFLSRLAFHLICPPSPTQRFC